MHRTTLSVRQQQVASLTNSLVEGDQKVKSLKTKMNWLLTLQKPKALEVSAGTSQLRQPRLEALRATRPRRRRQIRDAVS